MKVKLENCDDVPCAFARGGYRIRDGRIQRRVKDKWVAVSAGVIPYARELDLDTREHGIRVRFPTQFGESHMSIGMAELVTPRNVIARLAGQGCAIPSGRDRQKLLVEMLQHARPTTVIYRVRGCGWLRRTPPALAGRRVYVLGTEALGAGSKDAVAVVEGAAMEFKAAGTLRGWVERVSAPCGRFPIPTLAIALSLSAPLARLLELEPPGGGINLYGEPGTGKSTCIDAALSVWGPPTDLRRSWSQVSDAGVSAVGAALNDCVVTLDEVQTAPPAALWKALYSLANGTQATKATQGGGLRPGASFAVQVFIAGEKSMRELLLTSGRSMTEGQAARFLEVGVPKGVGVFEGEEGMDARAALSKSIVSGAAQFHGVVGRRLVRLLTRVKEEEVTALKAKLEEHSAWLHSIVSAARPTTNEHRALRRLALAMVAAELATQHELTGWEWNVAKKHFRTVIARWISDLRGGRIGTTSHMLTRLAKRLCEDLRNFRPLKRAAVSDYGAVRGFTYKVNGKSLLMLPPLSFKRYCKPYSIPACTEALRTKGFLRVTKGSRYQARVGGKRKNFIAIRRRLIKMA